MTKLYENRRAALWLSALLLLSISLQAQDPTVTGTQDDTPGVWLFSAGGDSATCDAGDPGGQPTDDIVLDAVGVNALFFIGDEAFEVNPDSTVWGTYEGTGTTGVDEFTPEDMICETNPADPGQGLCAIDDFGDIANGGDDNANVDMGTGGKFCLQYPPNTGVTADGTVTTGELVNSNPADSVAASASLDGFEIFIFEDAELSGMKITLYTNGGAAIEIDIADRQVDPNTQNGADDTLIAIDLDTLPGYDFTGVTGYCIEDDGMVMMASDSPCNVIYGDTYVEIDAIATRWDTFSENLNPEIGLEKLANGEDEHDLGVITPGTTTAPVTFTFEITNLADAAAAILNNVQFEDVSFPSCATFISTDYVSGVVPDAGPANVSDTIVATWNQLGPGESSIISATFDYIDCPTALPPGYVNTATVTADEDDAEDDSATVILENGTLPIEWKELSVVAEGRSILVNWTTLEQYVERFEIQLAGSAGDFATVAHVDASGSTNEIESSYSFRIADMDPGLHLLRIKSVENDGTIEYSPTLEVQTETPGSFVLDDVYPNPFNPTATVTFALAESVPARVELFTANGRFVKVLYEGTPAADQMQSVAIDGSDLASGLYVVRLLGPNFIGTKNVMLIK